MTDPRPLRFAIVGARRARQGTGEWIARDLARLGCEVTSFVGTSSASLEQARVALERHGIRARGYLSLPELLRRESVDAVVVASPAAHHAEQVEQALEAGRHVFCEKPFFWPFDEATLTRLLDLAQARGVHLALNTQWPETLPAFFELHPDVRGQPVRELSMTMGPVEMGPAAVIESGPHVLSLLEALVGAGEATDVRVHRPHADRMELAFRYEHAQGRTDVELGLLRTPEPPRPAGYRINGRSVERRITMPGYQLSFEANGRTVPIVDPLGLSVEAFVRAVRERRPVDRGAIERGMRLLDRLVRAASVPGAVMTEVVAKTTRQKQVELAPVHDFAAKLCQPSILPRLKDYVRWQAEWRKERANGKTLDELLAKSTLEDVPVSINLDVTTACNYRCDHCVDMDILNTGIRYDHDKLKSSLTEMAQRGLKSVIIIGGGEPTVYPGFEEIVRHLKSHKVKVGVVTNGSGMDKIKRVADVLDSSDWVRLSLDSGSDPTFQAMHKPRKPISLDQICEGIAPVKAVNKSVRLGFSYIIVWKDCTANDAKIVENVHEIVMAAERARKYGFDYISFKPFLTRAPENNAEIVGLTKEGNASVETVMTEIRRQIDIAKKLETDTFKVLESTNLKVLENGTYRNYTEQPRNCHVQFFRQVLSPLGLYNCPVYRHVPQALIGDKHAYAEPADVAKTQKSTLRIIETFNATDECKEVTCLYNHVNWFLEDLIQNPQKLEQLQAGPEREDFFL